MRLLVGVVIAALGSGFVAAALGYQTGDTAWWAIFLCAAIPTMVAGSREIE